MAAREVLSDEARTKPKGTTGIVESLRLLKVVASGAVKARAAALMTLGQLLVTAPAALREQIDARSLPGRARQCACLRPDVLRLGEPTQAAKYALPAVAREIAALEETIA